MSEHKWYVIRAISGKEQQVKSYLDKAISRQKLENFIPEVLIPSKKVYEVRNGKKRIREKNFFPGYILVSADLSHGEVTHLVKSIPGVIGFLGSRDGGTSINPTPLRQSEVNKILGNVDEAAEEREKFETSFIVGETVMIMDGPFSGFTGNVEEVFDEKKKLNIMVKIFGRNTPMELNYMQVEKKS